MKYYSPLEYQHCLQAARRFTRSSGDTDVELLHALLMEQRESAATAAYQRGVAAGVQAEQDRLKGLKPL